MSHAARVCSGGYAGQTFLTESSVLALNCTWAAPALSQCAQVCPSSAASICSALNWALCKWTCLWARLSRAWRSGRAQTGNAGPWDATGDGPERAGCGEVGNTNLEG